MWFNEMTFARVLCIAILSIIIVCAIAPCAFARDADTAPVEIVTWNDGVDYLALMEAVLTECGDDGLEVARILETRRNQKISDLKLPIDKTDICCCAVNAKYALKKIHSYKLLKCHNYDHEDLTILAALIWVEAGDDSLSEEWKFCVGEVALNRVLSDYFPDTLKEVVNQPGQYDKSWTYYYQKPSFICIDIAQRLLEGERMMEPNVVYQSGVFQGDGIYKTFYSPKYGYTYLCYQN